MTPPPEVDEFLRRPNAAVMGCVRPDGYPMTVVTWYDWDGEQFLVNMDRKRSRLAWMRANPHVSLTVFTENWYSHVSLTGDVVRIEDDPQLDGIDQLAKRYTGKPFWNRNAKRVNAWIKPLAWHVWELDRA
ncbi:MAG TPA: pyridoxamine 5'-phosphate oxidase family protein [Candidatus Dormibacteraeota bacterium]|nr:pyridoxamine 5'-phosphate oxidase family protein [Candidatus Dormibacteraeota bacterium]